MDNTFLTPWVVRPLELGADMVLHSLTKYINGHSDVIMGSLLTDQDDLQGELEDQQRHRGATPSAFDCYLVHRYLVYTVQVPGVHCTGTWCTLYRYLVYTVQVPGVHCKCTWCTL